MRKLIFALTLAATMALHAAPISQADRDALINDLERSRKVFLDAIADVKTEAQWNYKPAPDRWSVAECAAHIIAAEQYFRDQIAATLKTPALPVEKRSNAGDAVISKMVRDRSSKFQAPAQLEPKGKVVPKARAITDFEATRAKTLDYVRTTQDPLREHGSAGPGGQVTSAYQLVLMLSGHTERHTAQLQEVKASAGYPR
jgi:hypothetical protein